MPCAFHLVGTGNVPSPVGEPACIDSWGLSRPYSGIMVRLISFVSHLLGITVLCCRSCVLKSILYILSVFLVVAGYWVNLVPVSSFWLQVEVVNLLFYHLFFLWVLTLTHLFVFNCFILMGKCSSVIWSYIFPDWVPYLVLTFLFFLNNVCMVAMQIILILFIPNIETAVRFLTMK